MTNGVLVSFNVCFVGLQHFFACSGTRRRKVLVPHDSTALLNQLRLEEKEREREQRRQQMLEKQKEREEFEQTLQGWEDELLEQPIKDYMRTMWEVRIISKCLCVVM